ncbi:MAG: hypothetical protein LUH57_03705 [Ruminococcus sp.]|nr:hypothetical protein [Ruminococcus sp.]
MRARTILVITTAVFVICAIIGVITKNSFIEFDLDESYVGIFPESLMDSTTEMILDEAENYNIVCIEAIKEAEVGNYGLRQEVRVVKTFNTDKLKVGDVIQVAPGNTMLYANSGTETDEDVLPKESDSLGVNFCFVNTMTVGDKYLAFLTDQILTHEKLYTTAMLTISPLFSYSETQSTPLTVDEDADMGSVTKYKYAKDNEFFGGSEECIDKFYKLKETLLETYPL